MFLPTQPGLILSNLTSPLFKPQHYSNLNSHDNKIKNIDEKRLFFKSLKPIKDDFYETNSSKKLTFFSSFYSTSPPHSSFSKSTLALKKKRNGKQQEYSRVDALKQSHLNNLSFSSSIHNTTTSLNNTITYNNTFDKNNFSKVNKDNVIAFIIKFFNELRITKSENTSPKPHKKHKMSPFCLWFTILWNIFIVGSINIFGLVANTLSIIVLSKDKNNPVPTFLLKTLATFDNIVLTVSFVVLFICNGIVLWSGYDFLRLNYPYIISYINPIGLMGQTCVIWSTVLLAINRFIAVCRPFSARRNLTLFRARMQVLVMVITVILLSIPFFMRKNVYEKKIKNSTSFPSTSSLSYTILFSNFSGNDSNGNYSYSNPLYELGKHISDHYNTGARTKFQKKTLLFQLNNLSTLETYNHQQTVTKAIISEKNDRSNPFFKPSKLGQNKYFVLYYYKIIFNFLTVGLPIFLLIALNIPVIYSMRNSRRMMQQNSTMYRGRQEKNITTVMTIIIIELLVCHIPDKVLVAYTNSISGIYTCPHPIFFMHFIFNLLVLINSSSDFIIYYIFRSRFRNILKKELCSKLTKRINSFKHRRSTPRDPRAPFNKQSKGMLSSKPTR